MAGAPRGGRAGGRNIAEVDYDVYTEGEAELGWLNLTLEVEAPRPFPVDRVAGEVLERMHGILTARRAEAAHIKLNLRTAGGSATASWVGAGSTVRTQGGAGVTASKGQLILNARVHIDPQLLLEAAEKALEEALGRHGARGARQKSSRFRPGRPVPTHRFAAGDA